MGWASQRRPHRCPSYLSQASCVIVSGVTAALDLDTYPLRNLIHPRCAERAKPGRGKPVHYAYWLFSLFSRHISRTQSFQQNRHIIFLALVALKLLVSLISRLVAYSPRIVVHTHTHTQTHRTTTVTLAAHARRGLIIQALIMALLPTTRHNIGLVSWIQRCHTFLFGYYMH